MFLVCTTLKGRLHFPLSGREVQANNARCGRVPNTSSVGPSSGELVAHLRGLMGSALTSRKSYQRAWRVFQIFHQRFYRSLDFRLPLSSLQIALFISYLYASKLALSTITSYLSANGYVQKIKGLQDLTKSFLILKLLTALGRQRSTDVPLPRTRPVLHELSGSLRYTNSSAFKCSLYSTMFLVAFYGFFRIGELATKSVDCAASVVQFREVKFLIENGKANMVMIVITQFKHNPSR